MKKANIYVKHLVKGTMSFDDKQWPPDNVEINITLAPDCRILDMEQMFREMQNILIRWTRNTDTEHKYVIEE